MNANLYEQELTSGGTTVISHSFPQVRELVDECYVKLIQSFWGRPRVHFLPYIAIYCPDSMITAVKAQISGRKRSSRICGIS